MSNQPENPHRMGKSHSPLLPKKSVQTTAQALAAFLPVATLYILRHLTIGAFIRLRRKVFRRWRRVYYV